MPRAVAVEFIHEVAEPHATRADQAIRPRRVVLADRFERADVVARKAGALAGMDNRRKAGRIEWADPHGAFEHIEAAERALLSDGEARAQRLQTALRGLDDERPPLTVAVTGRDHDFAFDQAHAPLSVAETDIDGTVGVQRQTGGV